MNESTSTDDVHISGLKTLLPPAVLIEELPLPEAGAALISETRAAVKNILDGHDDRLIVVAGPCSIHDPDAALEYADKLGELRRLHADDLLIIMRVYFEKPRTTVGWKGLINDPNLDNSFDINHGLRVARELLLNLTAKDIPTGCEFLDTISPQYFAELVAWGAIGARTTESQVHRELASGLSMPVGFKNGTDGNIKIAVDAVVSASRPHHFLSVTKQGNSAIVSTTGNHHCHVILRGASSGPNFDAATIQRTAAMLAQQNQLARLMIDCSHGNSNKDFRQQPGVAEQVADQLVAGSANIAGVMIESNLYEGNQSTPEKYGVSITDACISWETTEQVAEQLAAAIRQARAANN